MRIVFVRGYPSVILFHGPGARARVMERVRGLGRLLHEPYGGEGLKIDEAREIVELMEGTPLGGEPGVIVIGPMDLAWPASADVLLKSLEEFDSEIIRPVLWAHDVGGVRVTIRSRCLHQWCGGSEVTDVDLRGRVRDLVQASLRQDRAGVLEVLRDIEGDVLVAASQVLREGGLSSPGEVRLWERIRGVLRYRGASPTATEIKAVFL